MRLSVAVMGHPRRQAWIEELVDRLGGDVPVALDPYGPSKRPAQRWANGRRAWEMADPGADFHMVIQDDALVCDDLIVGLEKALDQLPDGGLMSPYTGRGRPNQGSVKRAVSEADRFGYSWLATWSLNWGVAIVVPTATIGDMLTWCSQPARVAANYDQRIGIYYRDILGWRTWYTNPSLVEHRDSDSLIGHGRGGDRVAHRFHTGSALDVDWTATPAGLPLNPYLEPSLRDLAERSFR